jgi:hypothetical protein
MSASWQNKYLVQKRKGFPESCDHTIHPTDQHGKPAGSWLNTISVARI